MKELESQLGDLARMVESREKGLREGIVAVGGSVARCG